MSKHYAPKLENKLQSELRRNGSNLPGHASNYRPGYKKPYEKKVYEGLKLPGVMELGQDGKTHINTGDQAKTPLGRMLSQSYNLPFNHSLLGEFKCINGFWSYLTAKTRNDRVRHLSGTELRNYSKNGDSRRVDNFIYILLGAQWEKINTHPKLKTALKESTLPLDCYYITKKEEYDLRVRPRHADWMIWGFEEMRKALKEDREPNFKPVMDDPDKNIFECIFPNCDIPEEGEKPKAKKTEQPALLAGGDDESVDGNVAEPSVTEPNEVNGNAVDESSEACLVGRGLPSSMVIIDEVPFVAGEPNSETTSVDENPAVDDDINDQGQEPIPTKPSLDNPEVILETTE